MPAASTFWLRALGKWMSTTTTELVKANVQQYIAFQNAFDQCDPRIKDIIVRMLRIYNDEESSEQEKRLAFNTVAEALFPGYRAGRRPFACRRDR